MSRRRQPRRPAPTTDTRPPEVRLEALARERNPERALRMMSRIRADLDANPDPAPWLDAARTLSERLIISEDSWYYLAEMFTECLVYRGSSEDPELVRLYAEMEAIERAHGLAEDDHWLISEAPPEWRALEHAWNQRADEIINTYLRESGHADAAALRENDPRDYEGRSAQGRVDLWGRDEDLDDYDFE